MLRGQHPASRQRGERRGCAGSWGPLRAADTARAAGLPWPGSEQPKLQILSIVYVFWEVLPLEDVIFLKGNSSFNLI